MRKGRISPSKNMNCRAAMFGKNCRPRNNILQFNQNDFSMDEKRTHWKQQFSVKIAGRGIKLSSSIIMILDLMRKGRIEPSQTLGNEWWDWPVRVYQMCTKLCTKQSDCAALGVACVKSSFRHKNGRRLYKDNAWTNQNNIPNCTTGLACKTVATLHMLCTCV